MKVWVAPAVAWTACLTGAVVVLIAVWEVDPACDAARIWVVFGVPAALTFCAMLAAIWGAIRCRGGWGSAVFIIAAVVCAPFVPFFLGGVLWDFAWCRG